MINPRDSGKCAERRVAEDTNGIRMGVLGDDDVRCPPNQEGIGISFEVKTRAKLPRQLVKWFNQAVLNRHENNIPALVLKQKDTKWKDALVVLKYSTFLKYMVYFYKEKK